MIMSLCSCLLIVAQTKGDTTNKAKDTSKPEAQRKKDLTRKADTLPKKDTASRTDTLPGSVVIKNISSKDSIAGKVCVTCVPHEKTAPGFGEWILIAAPFVIFLLIFYSIGKADGFKFSEALTESDQTKQTKENPQYTIDNLKELKDTPNLSIVLPPTIEVTPTIATYRPSISRYIAFITSLFTLIITLSMTSFFIYHYVSMGCPPDLGAFSTILIALGIGMAPYIINKVSTAVKN